MINSSSYNGVPFNVNNADQKNRRICDYRARDIKQHGVKHLYHFTKLDNVPSIAKSGILPVNALNQKCIDYDNNDQQRLDGYLNGTSVSISFPNWKLFYKLRQTSQCRWAVIEINVDMLNKNLFKCFKTNAAAKNAEVYKGWEMFGNSNDEYPEDPQAELLVFDRIAPGYIEKIYVEDLGSKNYLQSIGKPVEINTRFFSKREKDRL